MPFCFFLEEKTIYLFFFSVFLQVSAALQTVSLGLMPCVHLPKKTSQNLKNCWKKRLPSLKNLCIIQVSWIHCFGNSVFHVSPVSYTIFLNDQHRFTLNHYISYLNFNKSLINNYFSSSLTVEVEDLKKVSNSLSVLLSEKQKQEKVSDHMLVFNSQINCDPSLLFRGGCCLPSPVTQRMPLSSCVNA